MDELYVAHKVVKKNQFKRYAFYHDDQVGCDFISNYLIDKRFVIVRKNDYGSYIAVNANDNFDEKYKEVDLNKIASNNGGVLFCKSCNNYDKKPFSSDCKDRPKFNNKMIGIIDVRPVSDFFLDMSNEDAIILINEHNDSLDEKYISVNKDNYGAVIREIDKVYVVNQSKSRKKVKTYN